MLVQADISKREEINDLSCFNPERELFSFATHELTQPVMVMNMYVCGCILRLKQNNIALHQFFDILTQISKSIDILAEKIHSIKKLSLSKKKDFKVFSNLHTIIMEVIPLLSYEMPISKISFNFDFKHAPKEVCINNLYIQEIILRIIKNCIQDYDKENNELMIKIKVRKKIGDLIIEIKTNIYLQENSSHFLREKFGSCYLLNEIYGGSLLVSSLKSGTKFQFIINDPT